MKEKKECKIIQDLLPNYMEGLTNEQTNQYIENHLKECTECKTMLNDMKSDLGLKTNKRDNREVNYLKKYNHKLRLLKAILLVIVAIFVIFVGRNIMIIKMLSNKAEVSRKVDNYYARAYMYQGNTLTIIESYYKEGKNLTVLNTVGKEKDSKLIEFKDGTKHNIYMESEGNKIALLDVKESGIIPIISADYLATENIWQFLRNAVLTKIKTVTCNGKDAYYFTNLKSPSMLYSQVNYGVYIDKVTGLPIRGAAGTFQTEKETIDTMIDYDYQFNIVTEEQIKEPDITQYDIISQEQ